MEGGSLLERTLELDACDAALREVQSGPGRVLALLGPAGIGKTQLLRAARGRAEAAGFRILAARGAELERDFGFGVVRQLFERTVVDATAAERSDWLAGPASAAATVFGTPSSDPDATLGVPFAAFHSLYWLTSNLSRQQPLAVLVDDAHWADTDSLRWLVYLAGRLEELRVLVVIAGRPGEASDDLALVHDLVSGPAARMIELHPLSERAVRRLAAERLGEVDDEFARACHAATAGNPYLLGELLTSIAADGITPDSSGAVRVGSLGPDSLRRAVLVRLARMSPAARPLARAASVLWEDAALAISTELAELDWSDAARAADELVAAGILASANPLQFRHPVVRSAIYADLGPGERERAHRKAATLLAERGLAESSAAQLLHTEPANDRWVVDRLVAAGERALARGAPDAAAGLLDRARREQPMQSPPSALLRNLGLSKLFGFRLDDAIDDLRASVEAAERPSDVLIAARWLGAALFTAARYGEAIEALGHACGKLPADDEGRFDLASVMLLSSYSSLGARDLYLAERPVLPPSDAPESLAMRAFQLANAGGPAEEAAALARRALAEGLVARRGPASLTVFMVPLTLFIADDLDVAHRVQSETMQAAVAMGSSPTFAGAVGFRSIVNARLGRIADAEADARAALDAGMSGLRVMSLILGCSLARVHLEQGDIAAARATVDEVDGDGSAMETLWLEMRGLVSFAEGDFASSIDDFLECGRRERQWESQTPGLSLWRCHAACALAAVGRTEEARELAREGLERTRSWGSPRTIGIAEHALALVEGGDAGIALLRDAVGTLAKSSARLDHARALVDLGTALRKAGHMTDARESLRKGLATARECGALALARHAHDELTSTGARPRKIIAGGVDALTASERRVAQMVAGGMTNREVAQALFVTVRTVETHLQHVYQKLGIHSRGEIGEAIS